MTWFGIGMIWFIAGWLICGVLLYGLEKNRWRQFFQKLNYIGYDSTYEGLCIASIIFGPIGLFMNIIITILIGDYKLGFCWRMPKELCEPRHPK